MSFDDLRLDTPRLMLRVAEKLGSRNLGPGRLPPPFAGDPVDLWGQSREEWQKRRGSR